MCIIIYPSVQDIFILEGKKWRVYLVLIFQLKTQEINFMYDKTTKIYSVQFLKLKSVWNSPASPQHLHGIALNGPASP